MPPSPPASPSFPYTTLFRSLRKFRIVTVVIKVLKDRPRTRQIGIDPRKEHEHNGSGIARRDPGKPYPDGNVGFAHRSHPGARSEEHTSELQSRFDLVCRLLL